MIQLIGMIAALVTIVVGLLELRGWCAKGEIELAICRPSQPADPPSPRPDPRLEARELLGQARRAMCEKDHRRALHGFAAAAQKDPDLAQAWHGAGVAYLNLKDLEQARKHLLEALRLAERHGDKQGTAASNLYLAVIHRLREELPQAERLFLAALATAEQYGPKSTMARASGWLGVVYARAGDLRQACRYWARARSLHQELATAAAEDCVQQTEALSVDMLERSMRNARCPGS